MGWVFVSLGRQVIACGKGAISARLLPGDLEPSSTSLDILGKLRRHFRVFVRHGVAGSGEVAQRSRVPMAIINLDAITCNVVSVYSWAIQQAHKLPAMKRDKFITMVAGIHCVQCSSKEAQRKLYRTSATSSTKLCLCIPRQMAEWRLTKRIPDSGVGNTE